MSWRSCSRLVAFALVASCGFSAPNAALDDGGTSALPDGAAPMPDVFIPPPVPCMTIGEASCVGDTGDGVHFERLRQCQVMGQEPVETVCPWRCVSSPTARCRKLVPSGGAVTSADLDPTMGLTAKDWSNNSIQFNTSDGSIRVGNTQVRGATTGIDAGVEFKVVSGVGIWRFQSLKLTGGVEVRGTNAAAFVAIEQVQVIGELDARGDCQGTNAGPGGFPGGSERQNGGGGGSGGERGDGNNQNCSGGGGGAYGGSGGDGGGDRDGGDPSGDLLISMLRGGGGGGGGGGDNNNGGSGGGGGGAIQIVANQRVVIDGVNGLSPGGVNAGGCGGKPNTGCGGGGGAGGAILVEAATVVLDTAVLAVNGGGGAGGRSGQPGQNGARSLDDANGGNGGNDPDGGGPQQGGGDGGNGAAGARLSGTDGQDRQRAGGGGGGAGRIRFNSLTGGLQIVGNVFVSPLLANGSTVSRGPARVE